MKIIRNMLLSLTGLLAVASCVTEDSGECKYNVRLEYRYRRDGALGGNETGFYIHSVTEYVFNDRDTLVGVNNIKIPYGKNGFHSGLKLAAGRYAVVLTGNLNGAEEVGEAVIGRTTLEEMAVRLNNPSDTRASHPPCDRMFYGYRQFAVEKYGVSRIAVDFTQAYCAIDVAIRWKDASGHPLFNEAYALSLDCMPASYGFAPAFVIHNGIEAGAFSKDGDYPVNDSRRMNYIPAVGGSTVSCSAVGKVSAGALYGSFTTFRLRGDSRPKLKIMTPSGLVIKEIDLHRFFSETGVSTDCSLRQEYSLEIEIRGDQVSIGLVDVDGWGIGGKL